MPAASLAVLVVVGCGESVREQGAEVECTSDLDCAEGQRCDKEGVSQSAQAARAGAGGVGSGGVGQGGAGGTGFATGGTGNPCPMAGCLTTGCPAGQVCRTNTVASCPAYGVCSLDCNDPAAAPCAVGTVCRSSGLCEVHRCDEADYPGCPAGMMCDPMSDPAIGIPGRYSLFGTDGYPFSDYDRGGILSAEQSAAALSRCVFLRCDEMGALACADGFMCDGGNATTTTGCFGIPCGELGRCATSDYICEPTSAGPHSDTRDAHGCVLRNCEEGRVCPTRLWCNVERATTGDGCVPLLCTDPGGSCDSLEQKCALDMQPERLPSGVVNVPDAYGCVPKRCDLDGYTCPTGMVCNPSSTLGTVNGCARPPADGTGGTGAGGTGAGGTAAEAGAPGDPGAPGVCR